MAKKICTTQITVEGDDIVVRFVNGRVAEADAPKVNPLNGKPNKKGMVAHTGGFQAVDTAGNFVSGMLMRKV